MLDVERRELLRQRQLEGRLLVHRGVRPVVVGGERHALEPAEGRACSAGVGEAGGEREEWEEGEGVAFGGLCEGVFLVGEGAEGGEVALVLVELEEEGVEVGVEDVDLLVDGFDLFLELFLFNY